MKILISPFAKKLPNNIPNAKDYPIYYWKVLIKKLLDDGHTIIQVGVDGEEQLCDTFIKNATQDKLKDLILNCDFFISVDSFIQHLAWYYDKKGIVIFSKSDPLIFGHTLHTNILKDVKYLRPKQFAFWTDELYDISAFPEPEYVYGIVKSFIISNF